MQLKCKKESRSPPLLFRQFLLDARFHVLRLRGRLEAADDIAFAADEELGEVPLDVGLRCVVGIGLGEHLVEQLRQRMLGVEAGKACLALQPLVDGMSTVAIDLNLRHKGEGDTMVQTAELLYLLVSTRLLMTELVAGEAYDDKSLVLILLVERLEAVVLRGEAALAGGVDDEQRLALVVGEAHFLALVREGGEIINLFHVVGVCCFFAGHQADDGCKKGQ